MFLPDTLAFGDLAALLEMSRGRRHAIFDTRVTPRRASTQRRRIAIRTILRLSRNQQHNPNLLSRLACHLPP
jgi:hypothetical protein